MVIFSYTGSPQVKI